MLNMSTGQRATFVGGANGVIERAFNGGALYLFRADNGVVFTVYHEEVAPEGRTPKAKPVNAGIACRTVVRFDRPSGAPAVAPHPNARRAYRIRRDRDPGTVFDDATDDDAEVVL